MSHQRLSFLIATCLAFILLASCTRPISKAPTAIPSVAITQAAQTMVAKLTTTPVSLTQAAASPTPAQATKPAAVELTNTPVQPMATSKPETIATPTVPPAVTPNPSDPIAGLGNSDWHEAFDGTGTWYAYQDEFIRFQAKDNQLEMTAYQADNRNGWALAPQLVANKFYVEMTATFGGTCRGADRFGLMLSPVSSADKGYLFGLSCEGKFVLWKWDGTRITALVKWTASEWVQAGPNKTNRIGIKADGNKLSLYANGSLLTELTDKTYDKLYFGIFIGASETAKFMAQVSGLNYWALP